MGPVAVEASGLGFTWPSGRRGVVGVDLTVAAGERVVVMGPNGSGKSTLVRLLTGELRPSSGSLRVLGAPPADADAALRRRTGVAGDRAVHLDALTGRENALLFARAHGLEAGAAAERTDELLRAFDLGEVADVPVDEYSLGMRRKLLLVEALAHDPELLLLDEPTLGLDPPALDVLAALVGAAAGRGAASVVATNDVSAAPGLADRIVFLHEGRIVADAAPADLLADLEGGASVSVGVEAGGAGAVLHDVMAAVSGEVPVADARIDDDGLSLRLPRGSADAPGLLEALVRRGVAVRRLDIREPDLGDVFRRLTGRELVDGAGASAPRGRA